jgi:hypothetical protein
MEEHFETFGKLTTALLKIGIFTGGVCVVAYSLRIGRFPQGLTIGDSLLLLMAAICFGGVMSMFIFSLVGLGIMLSPAVRFTFWIASKLVPKFDKALKQSMYALAPISWFAAVGALFAILMISALAQRDLTLAWNLPMLSIALYFFYSIYVSANKQLAGLVKIVESPVETSSRHDYRTLQKISKMKLSRWAAPFLIVITPLLFGGATGEVLDASMRAAKIRIEPPIAYIKKPYSSLIPQSLVNPALQAPAEYAGYKGLTVLFQGFGTVTVVRFKDGIRLRTLDIPNEYIIVERS